MASHTTVHSVEDVLAWCETHASHRCGWEYKRDQKPEDWKFFYIAGHGKGIRFSREIARAAIDYLERPGGFDSRMYVPNAAGKERLAFLSATSKTAQQGEEG